MKDSPIPNKPESFSFRPIQGEETMNIFGGLILRGAADAWRKGDVLAAVILVAIYFKLSES